MCTIPSPQLAEPKVHTLLKAYGHVRKLRSYGGRERTGGEDPRTTQCPIGRVEHLPSDVARAAAPDNWRPLMEPVREAARHMVAHGEVQITQGGEVVDPESVRGPIRIRWAR